MNRFGKDILKKIFTYTFIVAASLILLTLVMQLWNADINVPFGYSGDSLLFGEFVKSMMDNGWYLHNPFVAMPYGQYLHDYPLSDNLNIIIQKIISLFSSNYAATINIFFILTFPLTASASYYVFRKFNVSPVNALVGALLYAFTPYHFFRGVHHVYLASYFMIPYIVLILMRIFSGQLDLWPAGNRSKGYGVRLNGYAVAGIIICLLLSSAGIYYSFFACLFLVIAGLTAAIWEKKISRLFTALFLAFIIVLGGLINTAPTLIYQMQNGKNLKATQRVYHDTELYALKITHLLLPVNDHRIKLLADFKNQYNKESNYISKFVNTDVCASLGLVGSCGFMILILFVLCYRKNSAKDEDARLQTLHRLGILNISAILIAIIGGFNSFISIAVNYRIRAYNRMSIYIAFFSLFAVVVLLDFIYDNYIKDRVVLKFFGNTLNASQFIWLTFLLAVLAGGVYDETGSNTVPDYKSLAERFKNDGTFVGRIEKIMPEKAMIFQLPYIPFPEEPPLYGMGTYDHFRCYLHSKNLRWSYGAMKGRKTDEWQKAVSARPIKEMISELSAKGFKGICINKTGYQDKGVKIIQDIGEILGVKPILDKDKTMAFFSMLNYSK